MEELFKDDNVSRKFIKLLIDRIDDVKLKKYSERCNYQYEIINQYEEIEFLIKIGNFYIVIVDKIELEELSYPMFKYIQELTENGVKEKNIFACHYQMFEDSESVYKFVDSVVKRKDIINLLEKEYKSLDLENYYLYLKELDKYSSKRDIVTNDLIKLKEDISKAICTSFYKELEEKEGSSNIIGWEYIEDSKNTSWKYLSRKLNSVESEDIKYLYVEVILEENKNLININLAKKNKKSYLNLETTKIETKYYYKNNGNFKEKIHLCCQEIEEKLKNKLKEYDVFRKLETKDLIDENVDNEKMAFVKIMSLDINKNTLNEVKEILNAINNCLIDLRFKI